MGMQINIKTLQTKDELLEAYSVMRELRPELDEGTYFSILDNHHGRYKIIALYDEDQLMAVAGIEIQLNLYDLRHMRVHDLVTREGVRSRGYGKKLMDWIEVLSRKERCEWMVLSSGVKRTEAHSFYRSQVRYEHKAEVFMKKIDV